MFTTKVSIPQWCDCCRGDEHDGRKPKTSFNPTMVRLLLAVSSGTFVGYLLVSIPQWCDCCKFEVLPQRCDDGVSIPQWCDCCFKMSISILPEVGFQSHNGAIAASPPVWVILPDLTSFNPTMVRLLPGMMHGDSSRKFCFNPTMVRLLRVKGRHNGSIRSGFNPTMVRLLPHLPNFFLSIRVSFNPTMVRLLPCRNHKFPQLEFLVSIPQWCDCCGECDVIVVWDLTVSIPQWCDCCQSPEGRVDVRTRCFNPTMVRLLPLLPQVGERFGHRFQSHNGAIAAARTATARSQHGRFQSHNGAIAALFQVLRTFLQV